MNRRAAVKTSLLVALGGLALALRLPGIDRSLWYDELFTLAHFATTPWAAIGTQVAGNNHPPASLLAWFTSLFTSGAVGLRLPFALAGACAAPALAWALAPRDRAAGLLAGALIALSPAAVLASQQVRGYALVLPLLCLVLGLTLRLQSHAESEGPAGPALVGLSLTTALSVWSHGTALLVLAPILVVVGLSAAPGRKQTAAALLTGVGLGLLLWAPILGRLTKFVRASLVVGPPEALHPGPLTASAPLAVLGGGSSLLVAILLPLGLLGAIAATRHPRQRPAARLLLAPVAGAAAFTLLRPLGFERFLLVLLPSLLGLTAFGIAALARAARPPRQRALSAAILLACALPAGWTLAQQRSVEQMDLRGAVRLGCERAVLLDHPVVLALGPGGDLLGSDHLLSDRHLLTAELQTWFRQRAGHDPSGNILFQALLDGRDAVAIVPLPGWLEAHDQAGLRRTLYGAGFSAPLVLPGREGAVLIFATRTPPARAQ